MKMHKRFYFFGITLHNCQIYNDDLVEPKRCPFARQAHIWKEAFELNRGLSPITLTDQGNNSNKIFVGVYSI
jgi:hypothetical protein